VPWDDDDWVGEPPEGRYSRDRAKPDFWLRQHTGELIVGAAVLLLLAIALVVLLS
jgi:hypothetical protein